MRRNPFAPLPLLLMLLLLAVGLPAHAACTAGNPNLNVIESTPDSDFSVNPDGTVTHAKTGLMWKQCAEDLSGAACATGTATTMTWANALKAANTANTAAFAGHTDWRLPNKKELESIVESCGYFPSINQNAFPATPASGFWSGSSYVPLPANAWYVVFGNGFTFAVSKSVGNAVRLVRGGQSFDSFDLLDPNLTINDVSQIEGNSGTTTFTFTVSLSAPAGAGGVIFRIATAAGSATAPGDYAAKLLSNQTIPAGSSTYSFDVLVNGDTTFEPDETFFVNITNIANAVGVDTQGQGTIINDDASSNADLSSLTISAGSLSPAFASGTLAYTDSVPNATSSVTVTPTAADAAATIKVNAITVASGSASGAIALAVGSGNVINVVVTAQDGSTTKTYTITVTRAAPTVTTSYTGPSATGTGNITASFTGGGAGCGYTVSQFIPLTGDPASPPAGSAPAGVSFPQGLFDFTASGCTAGGTLNFTIVYPQVLPPGTQYWKYGPTAGDAAPHWYVLPATIAGNTATFSITDGGLGDDDLAANGTIADQGGPGAGLTGIPTLGEWAMLVLMLLLALTGARRMRRA